MPLADAIREEFKRSPVLFVAGVVGTVVAGLTLLLAWVEFKSPAVASVLSSSSPTVADFDLANLLLAISYFLGVTVSLAIALRSLARRQNIATFFASIPLVALANFSTIVLIYLAPPRPLNQSIFASAHDLVFYASASIIITFCGKAVMQRVVMFDRDTPAKMEESKSESLTIGGLIFVVLIILSLWSWLVFAGQTRLTKTFLPEVAHPSEVKPLKVGIPYHSWPNWSIQAPAYGLA